MIRIEHFTGIYLNEDNDVSQFRKGFINVVFRFMNTRGSAGRNGLKARPLFFPVHQLIWSCVRILKLLKEKMYFVKVVNILSVFIANILTY